MNEVHCFLDYPFAEKLMTMKKGHCRLSKKACMVLWVLAVGLCACTERPTIDAVIQTLHERQAGQKDNETLAISLPAGSLSLTRPLVLEDAHDLIIEGSGNHETVLSGDIAVVHWKRDAARPGVLVAALPDSVDLGCASGRQHRIDLYCDGHRQQLARWPNEGFTAAGRALGSTDVGDTWIHIHGSREGIFEYVDDRIDNWTREKDAFLHGYWYWDWAEESHHIETIDTLRKSISVMKPYHDYGYRDGLRFYGYNLLCELDADGEYYIDREDRLIYWKPCADYKAGKSRTALSVFDGEAAIVLRNCTNVTLRNVTLRGVRNRGIVVEGGRDVSIENCHLTGLGDNAVTLEQGSGHRVVGCRINELGCGGIVARGGNRRTLVPSGFVISDNVVQDFSLYKRTYEPAVYFHGAGIAITHNRFQGSSSSAMRVEGNDIDIAFNQCFDLVKESDDQGGLDTWYDFSYRRISIRNNHWRHVVGGMFAGAAAIRFDDIISGQEVVGNIFEQCGGGGFGAVQIHGGKDNVITGNVFYDCPSALSCTVWNDDTWESKYNTAHHLNKLAEVDCFSELYLSRYPELREEPSSARNRNYLTDNLVINASDIDRNHSTQIICSHNTLLTDTVSGLAHFLDPSVLGAYGIPPIPFDSIGPRKDRYLFEE